MFADPITTRSRLRLTLFFVSLLLLAPVSLQLFHLNQQGPARSAANLADLIEEAEAAAASRAQGEKLPRQQAPESIVETLMLAWNRGDTEAVARLFLPDGILVTPTGSVIRSRNEIRKRILDERQGRLKESTLRNTVDDVSLVDANTALVRGKYVLNGMKVLGVKTSPAGAYVLRQKKQQGVWMIAKAEVFG